MAENIIYYGPPGTGKTYHMQKQIEKYTDYVIDDDDIRNSYTLRSEDWLLVALVILQNNDPMSAGDIMAKIGTLGLHYTGTVSDVLEEHSVRESAMGLARRQPRIFFQDGGRWFADRLRLLEYDPDFVSRHMQNGTVEKRYDFVTFHQSFTYEDFVEGIRPSVDPVTKLLNYDPQPGVFKRICEKARANRAKRYALFIDEINRGNISEIFGELISLVEPDKREGQYCELEAVLPYSKTSFTVPNNLDIIGTMNSADKSIATIDMALRRRFEFVGFPCDYDVLEESIRLEGLDPHNIDGIDVVRLLKVINKRIELLLDTDHVVGHAYFMKVRTGEDIIAVLTKKLIPLLEEHFFDDLQKIQMILNDIDETGELVADAVYLHEELDPDRLLSYVGEYAIEAKRNYYINKNVTVPGVVKIYDGAAL